MRYCIFTVSNPYRKYQFDLGRKSGVQKENVSRPTELNGKIKSYERIKNKITKLNSKQVN